MSRRAHPKALVSQAHHLRALGHSYASIARTLGIGESTVRDWVTYYSRGAIR